MSVATTEDFVRDYLEVWQTTDAEVRRARTRALYAASATHHLADPEAVAHSGHDAIEACITATNERVVQGAGLRFETVRAMVNHDVLRLDWRTLKADGGVSVVGTDVLLRDVEGRIVDAYQFIER